MGGTSTRRCSRRLGGVSADPQPDPPQQDIDSDLGFGAVVARESRRRLLNRDGTFNVRREGLGVGSSLSLYHFLLNLSWPRFLAYAALVYVAANTLFACAYLLCGPGALMADDAHRNAFGTAFFFSVETLATIGYGTIAPRNVAADMVMTVESLTGLLGFALVAGIVFARFARPTAHIVFSRNAIVAPYRGRTALMFRIVNQRSSEIVNLEAKVMLVRRKRDGAVTDREFVPLKLERERVVFFPLTWTIVHPVDDDSPLHGCGEAGLRALDAEVLVLINGFDETFSQTVHTRSSYLADEVVWGARFRSVFNAPRPDGVLSVDVRRLDEIERVPLPV
jgi:inward rectifier potassium channel